MHRVKLLVMSMTLSLTPACNTISDPFPPEGCLHNDCCKTDQDCFELKKAVGDPDPSNWTCRTVNQLCVPIVVACTSDSDSPCCPGQKCSMITADDGICGDLYTSCDPNAPTTCTAKGQYCETSLGTHGAVGTGCTFHTCKADADCADGLQCFNGSCVGEAPCGGGCKESEICTPATNRCYRLGDLDEVSCLQTCGEGAMLVFRDPTNIFGLCDVREHACTCLGLPVFDQH